MTKLLGAAHARPLVNSILPGWAPSGAKELTQPLEESYGSCHDDTAWVPGLRFGQPPVRDQGRVHPPPPRSVQERHRLRRRPRAYEDRRPGHDQRVHPQPDLRGRGAARGAGGVLPRRQPRGQVLPRDRRRADAGHPGLPRPRGPRRADGRAGPRPHAHVPHARQPPRGAHAGRPRDDAHGDPLAQPVDPRRVVLQPRGPHLRHAGHHPADRLQGDRGARVVRRAGGPHGADPPGPGAGLRRVALVRLRGVRPVLAGRRRQRRAGVDARLRQRLLALPGRLDRPAGDAAVPARRLPHAHRRQAADRGHDGRLRVPRRLHPVPRAARGHRRERRRLGRAVRAPPRGRLPQDAAGVRREPGRGVPAQHLRQPVPRGRHRRTRRRAGRRPPAVRLRLPAPRGPGRPLQLRRPPARRDAPGRRGRDHGWQPRSADAGRQRPPPSDVTPSSSTPLQGRATTWI